MESEQVLARAARSGMVGLARARPVSLGSPLVGDCCKGQCQVGLVFGEGEGPSQGSAEIALSLWVHTEEGGVSSRCP